MSQSAQKGSAQSDALATAGRELGAWELRYHGWDPAAQPLREALTTLGNGYVATRGAAEESRAGGPHYPGTYLAGGYDRLRSEIAGRSIENEDLVNWPNWLPLSFRCEGGAWFELDAVEVLAYEQRLDLRCGVLERRVRFRDREGRGFRLHSRRLVHMEDPHIAAIQWVLTPLDWTGRIEVRSALDARVENCGVLRYRGLRTSHLETIHRGEAGPDAMVLVARTRQSQIVMAQAARTRVVGEQDHGPCSRRTEMEDELVAHRLSLTCGPGRPVRVEKVVAIFGSRDFAISEPRAAACGHIQRAPGFADLLARHELAWRNLWNRADLELVGQDHGHPANLRLHVFHLLQTASMNTIGRDVGIPARGLHGEAYRGHVFWDELFIFPFLNLRIPELTRSLLLYRYRRLDAARVAARDAGLAGAMFPWQSGSDGREETQILHLNPRSGRWIPDRTSRQRHVNAAIAYNVWQYYQATCDIEFLSFYGAEMLLEIARFWTSLATYDAGLDRWVIRGVVGPDEFHTHYPGRAEPGIDNNAYTNIMASWSLDVARQALDLLAEDRRAELLETLRIDAADLRRWDEVGRRIFVPFQAGGIISQFEGWEALAELDWERLCGKYGDVQRLDRILESEGDDVARYQATKQADVLMLFFLFSAEELAAIFERLGYPFEPGWIPANVAYYLARTSHGSSLSRVVHAWVSARGDRKGSWNLCRQAMKSDIDDIQGGTTSEGIHLGAMAGTVDLLQRCYTGIETRQGVLWLNPRLPDGLPGLNLSVRYRGHWLTLRIDHARMEVAFERGWSAKARVGFRDQIHAMRPGQTICFDLRKSEA